MLVIPRITPRFYRVVNLLGLIMLASMGAAFIDERATPVFYTLAAIYVPLALVCAVHITWTTKRQVKQAVQVGKDIDHARENNLPRQVLDPVVQEELMIARAQRMLAEKDH